MRRIYFDISDIVSYARHHSRVSGIQRVQWNIITNLARKHGSEIIRCTNYNSRLNSLQECRADEALTGDEFDPELLLIQLGLMDYQPHLPSRIRIKDYLQRFSYNKILRTLRKAEVYLSAYLAPWRLAGMGLERMNLRPQLPRVASLNALPALNPQDSLVLLGPHWDVPQVLETARRHKKNGGDVVQMVCDLIPNKFPQFANATIIDRFTPWLSAASECVTRFICISECTARDLRQFLQERTDRWEVVAIPLAHEFDHFDRLTPVPPPSARIAAIAETPFVLCVGTLEVRKNGVSLLRAWRLLRKSLGSTLPQLVFAGSNGWQMEEFTSLLDADPTLARIVTSPDDEELAALYQNCLFTVYPSFYEGWGLPVGESAWFGKYCIAANTSSIPEVCGKLIDYADPTDLDDLVHKLERALTNPQYVRERERVIAAEPLRRWTDVAEDMLQFIVKQASK